MTSGTITQFPVTHAVSADLTYAKFTADAQQIKIGTIPAGSLVKVGTFNLSTALSPTSLSMATVEIGTAANASLFLASSTIDTFSVTPCVSVTAGRGLVTVDTDVYVRLNKAAMAAMPTTGRFQYALEYFPPNTNKHLRSTFDT